MSVDAKSFAAVSILLQNRSQLMSVFQQAVSLSLYEDGHASRMFLNKVGLAMHPDFISRQLRDIAAGSRHLFLSSIFDAIMSPAFREGKIKVYVTGQGDNIDRKLVSAY